MHALERFQLVSCFGAVLILLQGCKPSAEQQRLARLEQFRKRIEQVDAAITVGMPYSNLVAKIGEPFLSRTNNGAIMALYRYDPGVFHDLITNGFRVDVSNGVVVGKSEITGTFK
jgi:hypothetical protein